MRWQQLGHAIQAWNWVANGSWDALGHDYAVGLSILCALLRGPGFDKSSWAHAADGVGGCEQPTLQNVPGEVLNRICEFACDPSAIDATRRLEAWKQTKFPRTLQDKAREPQAKPVDPRAMKRSRDKMRSYKQVMPPALYQEYDGMFGFETPDMRDARLAKQRQTRIERLRAWTTWCLCISKRTTLSWWTP